MTDAQSSRISLSEAAYAQLRDDIVTCRLAPGQRVTEKQLAAEMGYGISPLRDALTRLDHEGLIRTLPRKGYQVTPLTPKLIDDLFVMWRIVAPEMIRLGVTNASNEQLQRARAGFEALDAAVNEEPGGNHSLQVVRAADLAFGELAAATGNEYLLNLFERISGDMARIWVMILESDPDLATLDPADNWIRHILTERDATAAAETAKETLRETHERVLRIVTRWPSVMRTEVMPMSAASRQRS